MNPRQSERQFLRAGQQKYSFFCAICDRLKSPRTILKRRASGDIRAGSTSGTGGSVQRKVETAPEYKYAEHDQQCVPPITLTDNALARPTKNGLLDLEISQATPEARRPSDRV